VLAGCGSDKEKTVTETKTETTQGTGTQATTGVVVPAGTAMLFYAITPQGGYTNAPTPGAWVGQAFA